MLTKSELETLSSILLLELHLRIWGLFFLQKKKHACPLFVACSLFWRWRKATIETRFSVAPSSTFTTGRAAAGTPSRKQRETDTVGVSFSLMFYTVWDPSPLRAGLPSSIILIKRIPTGPARWGPSIHPWDPDSDRTETSPSNGPLTWDKSTCMCVRMHGPA